jgi:hypothetical protein
MPKAKIRIGLSARMLDVFLCVGKKPTRVNVAELAARTPPAVIWPYEWPDAPGTGAPVQAGLAATPSGDSQARPADPAELLDAAEPVETEDEVMQPAEAAQAREARLRRKRRRNRYPFRRTSRDPRRPPRRARRRIRHLFQLSRAVRRG